MKQKNSFLKNCGLTIAALLLAVTGFAQCISGPTSFDVVPGQNVNSSSHYLNGLAGGNYYMTVQQFGMLPVNNLLLSVNNGAINPPGASFFTPGGSVPMTISYTIPPTASFCQQGIISLSITNYLGQLVCTFSYTINCRDNSKENLTVTSHGTYYVGQDFHIHRLYWTAQNGWQWQSINPSGGWGSVQVDGWLASEYYDNKVFFRSRDNKLYAIFFDSGGTWYLSQITTQNNVRSDVVVRPGEIFYIGTDAHVHRIYWNGSSWGYEAINPVNGGWQGFSITGGLCLSRAGSNVFFHAGNGQILNIVGSQGNWYLWGIYPPIGCTGDMVFDDATGLFYKGTDANIHKLYWNGSQYSYDAMTAAWGSNPVHSHLTKFPGEQRVFYEGIDGKAHNIYQSGSQWVEGALNNATIANDLLAADGKLFCISDFWPEVTTIEWNGSGWVTNWINSSAPDAKGCSTQYRLDGHNEAAAEPVILVDPAKTVSDVMPYPNPASGNLEVSWVLSKDANVTVALYNVVGERVKEMAVGEKPAGQHQTKIGLEDLAPGVYLLRVTAGTEVSEVQRVIVQ